MPEPQEQEREIDQEYTIRDAPECSVLGERNKTLEHAIGDRLFSTSLGTNPEGKVEDQDETNDGD